MSCTTRHGVEEQEYPQAIGRKMVSRGEGGGEKEEGRSAPLCRNIDLEIKSQGRTTSGPMYRKKEGRQPKRRRKKKTVFAVLLGLRGKRRDKVKPHGRASCGKFEQWKRGIAQSKKP